jgi:TusA-related sulfurtransferase
MPQDTMMADKHEFPEADHVFDGGSMDCGSGLILLIRQNMLEVPAGGILEIRSSEPTVEAELPPWCRMAGHTHVRSAEVARGAWRHWVRRGTDAGSEQAELESDRKKAQEFRWSVRARRTTARETTVYSRNFSWKSGNSVDFDRSGELPSSLEQFLGALVADVLNGFAIRCSRSQMVLDELEGTLKATLNNSLAAAGVESGDPSVREIQLVVYATSPAAEADLREVWNSALSGSPVFRTLTKSCDTNAKLVLL